MITLHSMAVNVKKAAIKKWLLRVVQVFFCYDACEMFLKNIELLFHNDDFASSFHVGIVFCRVVLIIMTIKDFHKI